MFLLRSLWTGGGERVGWGLDSALSAQHVLSPSHGQQCSGVRWPVWPLAAAIVSSVHVEGGMASGASIGGAPLPSLWLWLWRSAGAGGWPASRCRVDRALWTLLSLTVTRAAGSVTLSHCETGFRYKDQIIKPPPREAWAPA